MEEKENSAVEINSIIDKDKKEERANQIGEQEKADVANPVIDVHKNSMKKTDEQVQEENQPMKDNGFDIRSFLSDLEKMQIDTSTSYVQMNKKDNQKTTENKIVSKDEEPRLEKRENIIGSIIETKKTEEIEEQPSQEIELFKDNVKTSKTMMSDIYAAFKEVDNEKNDDLEQEDNGREISTQSKEIEEDNSNIEELLAEIKRAKEPPKEKEKNQHNIDLAKSIDDYVAEIKDEIEHQSRTYAKENYFSLTKEIENEEPEAIESSESNEETFEWHAFNKEELNDWKDEEMLIEEQVDHVHEVYVTEPVMREKTEDETINGMFNAVDDLILSENLNMIFGEVSEKPIENMRYDNIEHEYDNIENEIEESYATIENIESIEESPINDFDKNADFKKEESLNIESLEVDDYFKQIIKNNQGKDRANSDFIKEESIRAEANQKEYDKDMVSNETSDALSQVPPVVQHKSDTNSFIDYISNIVDENQCELLEEEKVLSDEIIKEETAPKEKDIQEQKEEKEQIEKIEIKKKAKKKKYVMELKIDKNKLKS